MAEAQAIAPLLLGLAVGGRPAVLRGIRGDENTGDDALLEEEEIEKKVGKEREKKSGEEVGVADAAESKHEENIDSEASRDEGKKEEAGKAIDTKYADQEVAVDLNGESKRGAAESMEELIHRFFKCANKADMIAFPRHGLLLGAVREHGFIHLPKRIDMDADVGYLEEDEEALFRFFKEPTQQQKLCLAEQKIKVGTDSSGSSHSGLKTCVMPPTKDVESVVKSAGAGQEQDDRWRDYCLIETEVKGWTGFVAHAGGEPRISLGVYSFPKLPGHEDKVFYDLACALNYNCALELRLFLTTYKGPATNHIKEGERLRFIFNADAFKPFSSVPWSTTLTVPVPRNATAILETLYGPDWKTPFDKKQ